MELTVERIHSDDDATLGIVRLDDIFQCFALEDEYREAKVPSETRIPKGRYKVGVKTHGGFHNRYLSRFGNSHQGMLQVMDVPNFTDILIHVGNTDEDTAGCLLVGQGATAADDISIASSVRAYKALYNKLITPAMRGELYITYIDGDLV